MTATALNHALDTLRDGATGFIGETPHPLPLKAMTIEVTVDAGLATITILRKIQNSESVPIEAVLTFPIPFDAVLTQLSLHVDGRHLLAVSKSRDEARDTYEEALDKGKMAVLHEEAMRGAHIISVSQLGPGREVDVVTELVCALSLVEERLMLRLPMTVGDIYGASPLLPADDLISGPDALQDATLMVRGPHPALLDARDIASAPQLVPLNRSIDLVFPKARFGVSLGHDDKGRSVSVALEAAPGGEAALRLSILFDISGSTADRIGSGTVWQAMVEGLHQALKTLKPGDEIELWEFADQAQRVGAGAGAKAAGLLRRVNPPSGGTQLGTAIKAVTASQFKDILVLTDGKTWSTETHEAAASGMRISAVLVGKDSFDAMIGHLAAMTGGQVFAAAGAEVATAAMAALSSLRTPGTKLEGATTLDRPLSLSLLRSGVRLSISWDDGAPAGSLDSIGRYAAAQALSMFELKKAEALAISHGLCTHLTSLVLVDDAGEETAGPSQMRKVPLAWSSASPMGMPRMHRSYASRSGPKWWDAETFIPFHDLALQIDWDKIQFGLKNADLALLPTEHRACVCRIAYSLRIRKLAEDISQDWIKTALLLLARASTDKKTRQLARKAFALIPKERIELLTQEILAEERLPREDPALVTKQLSRRFLE